MSINILLIEASLRMIPGALLFLITFEHHLRYGKQKSAWIVTLLLGITIVFPMFFYLLLDLTQWLWLYVLLYLLALLLVCHYLIDFSLHRTLLVLFTFFNYMCCVTLVKDWLGQYAQSLVLRFGYFPTSCCLRAFVLLLSFPLMALFCHKGLKPLIDQLKQGLIFRFLWFMPLVFCSLYYLIINPQDYTSIHETFNEVSFSKMVVWIIGIFTIYYLILVMMKETIEQMQLEEAVETSAMRNSIQQKMYENLLQKMKENRRNRHDFRHHVVTIQHFCEAQDYQGLQEYLNDYLGTISMEDALYFCENATVNSILQYYAHIAQARDIEFRVAIALSQRLHILDTDACTLISNAVENAIEACMRIKEKKRWISIQIQTFSETTYTMVIQNCYEGKIKRTEEGGFYSSKRKEEGIGIASIQQICQKYHGICNVSYDDAVFTLKIMLLPNIPS